MSEDGLLVVVEVDGPVVGVDEDVVAAAQQHTVVHAGFAVVFPVGAAVDIAPVGGPVTVREPAGAIALDDGVPDPFGPLPDRASDIEHLARCAQHDADPGGVSHHASGGNGPSGCTVQPSVAGRTTRLMR